MYNAGKLIFFPLFWVSTISMAQDGVPITVEPGCEFDSSNDGPKCRIGNLPALGFHRETRLSIHTELPKIESLDCKVEVAIQYEQRYSIARVAGSIANESCAASSGSLLIAISTKDENDELKTQEYPQTWKREGEEAVTFSNDYEIGNNANLIRVRALKSTCKCDSAK